MGQIFWKNDISEAKRDYLNLDFDKNIFTLEWLDAEIELFDENI